MTRPILLALAFLTLGVATPALAQDSMNDPCRSDDLVCRVDRLERVIVQLVDRLAAYEQSTDVRPRSVDVPVQSACSGIACTSVAVETCRRAGFPRGVPAAFSSEGAFMTRITCMD